MQLVNNGEMILFIKIFDHAKYIFVTECKKVVMKNFEEEVVNAITF